MSNKLRIKSTTNIMEKLIKNNREKLMSDLPAGHRERFAMKMISRQDAETQRRRDFPFIFSLSTLYLYAFTLSFINM